ncbi:MAG: CDP-alcohol phosphatidyltransferase family protein [Clostridia bacterium]|nr:CDP-alcohol phosphatidyltransferase family protein [Clostridia bacterium]
MTIPNILTVFRLILITPVVMLYLHEYTMASAMLFILACVTDILDGFIAREFNMISNVGKVLDPLADKLMTLSILIAMEFKGMLSMWVIVIFLVKELLMLFGGAILYSRKIVVFSSWHGKVATCVIWGLVLALFFFGDVLSIQFRLFIEGFACAITIFALLVYSTQFFKNVTPNFYSGVIHMFNKKYKK